MTKNLTSPDEFQDESFVLPVHKPSGVTSRTVIDEFESRVTDAKIGHAGTLDPLAEGVLPLHFNEATKTIPYLQKEVKTYRVRCRFDLRSESLDLGEPTETVHFKTTPSHNTFENILNRFVGRYEQIPPRYSAAKIDGTPMHELARDPEKTISDRQSKTVLCESITIHDFSFPSAVIEITCGKGFYVRSLVRDVSEKLNLKGGIVTALVRTKYGPFSLNRTCLPYKGYPDWSSIRVPPKESIVTLPKRNCTQNEIDKLIHGGRVNRDMNEPDLAMAIGPDDRLHAILEPAETPGPSHWKPKRVLKQPKIANP